MNKPLAHLGKPKANGAEVHSIGGDKPATVATNAHFALTDIFTIIGTSPSVYPAVGLTRYAHDSVPKHVVDPNLAVIPTGFTHIKANATLGVTGRENQGTVG